MHSVDLQNGGVPLRKIFSVTTWKESSFYSKREKLALELTERITLISEGGVPQELWTRVRNEFSEREVSDLILLISTINVWNRIAISTLLETPALEEQAGEEQLTA
ncbi:carboxymuconolactone decarboxylase family protein [Glaciibacter superstes]|uniref:carboxymuconolactone decarboxylase family protein n=1 Tax=Glaciibacter superstes TaxID=501023 RepID=UPI0003B6385C|nr:carboxymuconolactone decarboxylase family protein [Glaciibacter superstes]